MIAATTEEWLAWFYEMCDFGPAHEDCMFDYQCQFEKQTGKRVPTGYRMTSYFDWVAEDD